MRRNILLISALLLVSTVLSVLAGGGGEPGVEDRGGTSAAGTTTTTSSSTTSALSTPATTVPTTPSTTAPTAPATTVPTTPSTTAPTAPATTVPKARTAQPVAGPSPEDALWDGPVEVLDNGVIDVDGVRHGAGFVDRCGSFQDRTVRYWVSYANGAAKTYRTVIGPEPTNSHYGVGVTTDPHGNRLRNMIDISTDPAWPSMTCNTFQWSEY
jgi:hypothetical protein